MQKCSRSGAVSHTSGERPRSHLPLWLQKSCSWDRDLEEKAFGDALCVDEAVASSICDGSRSAIQRMREEASCTQARARVAASTRKAAHILRCSRRNAGARGDHASPFEGNSGRGVACIRAPLRATACTVRSVQDVVSWRLPRTEQRIGYKYCTHAARRRALVSTFPSLVPTCTTPSQRCARSLSRYQPDCEIFSPRVSVMPPSTLLTRTIG